MRISCVVVASIALTLGACAGSRASQSYATRKALAEQLVAQADRQRAFPIVSGLNRENPEDADVLALRGIIYREERLATEAEADLRAAIELNPKLARAHSALALLYETQRKGEEALEHHRAAVEIEPSNPSFQNNLGFALVARSKARDAIPILQQSLRLDPTSRRTRNNLGFAYGMIGDYRSAVQQFELAGGPAEAKHNLAFVYQRAGNLGQAFELYIEALRLDPKLESARKNLGEVARQLHRKVPADVAGNDVS